MKQLRCFLLPNLIGELEIAENVVVIDVLRASTTICAAIKNGAKSVAPFLTIEEAVLFSKADGTSDVLLGGEREGSKIEGFDVGNSPLEYSEEKVKGKTIAFTTTNGTKAMMMCRDRDNVLIGAFCNFSQIVNSVRDYDHVDLICSGTNGEITLEDCLFAGAVAAELISFGFAGNDQTQICTGIWESYRKDVFGALKISTGGRNLSRLGKVEDVEFAARIDSLPVLPRLDTQNWKISC